MKNFSLLLFLLLFIFSCNYVEKNPIHQPENNNLMITKSEFKDTYIGKKQLYYGSSYYPESWDSSEIDKDIQRMKELNMNVVRMGEFAWSSIEPNEGIYDFEWLHNVIEKLNKNGIDVILGTPTATPPIWLAEKYPDIFIENDNKTQQTHGGRKNYKYTSQIYRELSAKIVEKFVIEFGSKPCVIGWQTDNEFSIHEDFSKETENIWHEWLKNRYLSIDSLNNSWDNALWSQSYYSFNQIPMPRSYVWHNPSILWNWSLFWSEQVTQFQDVQVNVIRKYSKLPITHDAMPGQKLNYDRLFENLDFMAINYYHSFEVFDRVASNLDRVRTSFKGRNYWMFETAPNNSGGGFGGKTWIIYQPRSAVKTALWLTYANGGQGTLFWLWRQHWGGHEMVHGSVVNAWGRPAANYDVLKELGTEISKTSDFLMRTPVAQNQIALVYSHLSNAAFEIEQYATDMKYYPEWATRFYRPFLDSYIPRDVITENADISQYKLIMIPLCPYVSKEFRAKLQRWVENGGTLIWGPMTGYRNEHFASFTDFATGDIEKWSNIQVDARIPIGVNQRAAEEKYLLNWEKNNEGSKTFETTKECGLWAENLISTNGKILATYKNGMMVGKNAIIETVVGKGKFIYLGTDPGQETLGKMVIYYSKLQGITPVVSGDKGVMVVMRNNETEKCMILINLENADKKMILPFSKSTDLITGNTINGQNIILKPFETKVLQF